MRFLLRICALLAGFLAAANGVLADGGAVLLRNQAGPWMITVFGTPSPLRVGPSDVSVMVQNAADHSSILDAHVMLHFTQSDRGNITEVTVPATRGQAANKLLYAGHVTFPASAAGTWRLTAEVNVEGKIGEIAGSVEVVPPEAPILKYWPYFLVVLLIVLLFAANQWLKLRRRFKNQPAQP